MPRRARVRIVTSGSRTRVHIVMSGCHERIGARTSVQFIPRTCIPCLWKNPRTHCIIRTKRIKSSDCMYRISAIVLLAAVSVFIAACGGAESGPDGRNGPDSGSIPAVEVIQARQGSLPLEERMTGIVRAANQVAIYPEISAPVERVAVDDGDFVRQGQPLVYLRGTQYRDQLRQAEAALQVATAQAKQSAATLRELQSRLDRTKQLAEKQLQSQQELESIQAQVAGAEAAHDQALARISQAEATVQEQQEAVRRTVVRAPITGHVGGRDVEVGMRVDPSTHLFTMGDLGNVKVEVAIPDGILHRIETGQTALIAMENQGGQALRAEVTRISPFLDQSSYSARAEIEVANEEGWLRPGMFVTVDVLYGESEQATLLPTSALYEDPNSGVLGVYVATSLTTETPIEEPESFDEDNPPPLTEPTPMEFRQVQVLARGRGLVGVDAVQPGDWVVTVGQNLLSGRGEDRPQARARPTTWDRIAALQELQDQDLLRQFMEKQQRLAREARESETSGMMPALAPNESRLSETDDAAAHNASSSDGTGDAGSTG